MDKDMKRDFKGIWIPKEIWLDEKLGWSEKLLLVEINSLDNEDGCWATNDYFAEFFGFTKKYISKMINELKDKGYLKVKIVYKKGTKKVDKRIIRTNYMRGIPQKEDTPPPQKMDTPIPENEDSPLPQKKDTPIPQNAEDNNTSFNNTSFNNTTTTKDSNSTRYSENDSSSFENPVDNSLDGRDSKEVTDVADGRDSAPDAIPLDMRLKKMAVAFEQNGFGQLNATVKDALVDFLEIYSVEWIIEGMKECALSGKRSIKYLRGILENWQRNGGMTLSSDRKDKPKEEKKPPVKTRFHNFEQRSDNYTADQLEEITKRKRKEASERIKRDG